MGWSSAGWKIFAPVADGLIEAKASDEVKTKVCSKLISALTDEDWDTPEIELGQYKDDPAIVAAFAEHGITLNEEEDDPDDT
jgi:hypothetical protein